MHVVLTTPGMDVIEILKDYVFSQKKSQEERGQAHLPHPELVRVETVIALVNGFQR